MLKGKNTITFYTKKGLVLGTYDCPKYISHERRKEFAVQQGIEDDWNHYTVEDIGRGMRKDYDIPVLRPEDKYSRKPIVYEWIFVDDNGIIK